MKEQIEVIDIKKSKATSLSVDVPKKNDNLIFEVSKLINIQKKNRVVLSSTKSRSDFDSGGAKPYKQKGTGRARQGTIRSPLKVGGSVIFGPKPRIVRRKQNSKQRSSVLLSLLSSKISDSQIVDNFNDVKKLSDLNHLIDPSKTYLFILNINDITEVDFFNKIKNLKNVYFNNMHSIYFEDIVRSDKIIYTKSAFNKYFTEKNND